MSKYRLSLGIMILVAGATLGCGTSKPAPEEVSADPKAPAPSTADTAAPEVREKIFVAAESQPPAGQGPGPAAGSTSKLIPRTILFGNPDKAAPSLSRDGKQLSYLAPVNGVLNVFVGPVHDPASAQAVTNDALRGIRTYFWAYDNRHIIYLQDVGGDEDWQVFSVDVNTKEVKNLTPIEKIAAQIEGVSRKFPQEILVAINDRDPRFHEIYRINIVTGERKLVQKNDRFAGFVSDDEYQVRFAMEMTPDGGATLYQANGEAGWKDFMKIPFEDSLTTGPAGFDKTGKILYMNESRGRDTAALTTIDLASGEEKVLAADDKADVGAVMVHPTERHIQAVSFDYEKTRWEILDPAIAGDLAYLKGVASGEPNVTSRTLDDKLWIVVYLMDDGPVRYYLYDRDKKEAKFLFTNRKALEGQPLVKMHPVVIKARDGLNLVSYLSLPADADPGGSGRPKEPLPLVLAVHGGPWARDNWGFDPEHQLLANRGYAVLAVNYRGSTGFGKKFTNDGNKEWAAKMHDDLIDAVDWAVAEKIADPRRVAIMGGSYGGYATLVGLTFTPDKFACGVDIVGPSNLFTLLSTIPPYWEPMIQQFKDRVGDPTTADGRKLLEERSPLSYVEKIKRPLLIGQGANDPRVKQSEADQIVRAMRQKNIPVTYVLFPDEGHGFARPQNNLAFYAVTEAFLAKQLGGRCEPIGDDFAGSTITAPEGADAVPELTAALKKHASQAPAQTR